MKKIIVVYLFFAFTFEVFGQKALSLQDAIDISLKNKIGLRKAKLDQVISSERLQESKLKYLPDINGELTLQYNPIIATSIIPIGQFSAQNPTDELRAVQFGQAWSNSSGIRAKQTIFSPSVRNEVQEKKLELLITDVNELAEKQKTVYEVTKAYYSFILAKEELNVAAVDTLNAFKLNLLAIEQYEQKRLNSIEKQKAHYDLIKARFQFYKLHHNLENARSSLFYHIGISDNEGLEPSTDISSFLVKRNIKSDSTSIDHNITYREASLEYRLERQKIATQKAKLLPEISLNAYLGANQFSSRFDLAESNSWFGNSFVNINATIPLSAFYTANKNIQQAKARYQQSELSLQLIRQEFDFDSKRLKNNIEAASKDYLNQMESLKLSKLIYEDAVNRYSEGQALNSEVQTASLDLQEAQYRVVKSIYDVLINQLEFDRLINFETFAE